MAVDRTRNFGLPGIQDLNKDQDEALALPLEDQHLIVGGPGTGKSVVALLRAKRLEDNRKDYTVLVYNRVLNQSNRDMSGIGSKISVETWVSWFYKIYRRTFKKSVPEIKSNTGNEYRSIDWDAVERQIETLQNVKPREDDFLVIDEGQDMPQIFYQILISLGFENFYAAADQNQQIHPETCSSRKQIEDSLGIATDETLELKTNYRNTLPIAQLAQYFYPADPASPKPDLPDSDPAAMTPELWCYGEAGKPGLTKIAERILQLSDRNPRKLIGIITPSNKIREKFYEALQSANPQLDNGKPPVHTYDAQNRQDLDFRHGGIMVINAQSCKGLEFDTAILADIDRHQPKDKHTLKQRFYVMVARAREQIILLRTGYVCGVVDELLPDNPSILARK